jgi:hypothetical protein
MGEIDGETDFGHIRDWHETPVDAESVEFEQYAYAAAHDGDERSIQHDVVVPPPVPVPGTCEDTPEITQARSATTNFVGPILYLPNLSFH